MRAEEFTEEQKHYLEGFATGSGIKRSLSLVVLPPGGNGQAKWAATLGVAPGPKPHRAGEEVIVGPGAVHRAAQGRFVSAGKKLTAEEQAKRIRHGLDIWDDVLAHARDGRFPKGTDVFLFKF